MSGSQATAAAHHPPASIDEQHVRLAALGLARDIVVKPIRVGPQKDAVVETTYRTDVFDLADDILGWVQR